MGWGRGARRLTSQRRGIRGDLAPSCFKRAARPIRNRPSSNEPEKAHRVTRSAMANNDAGLSRWVGGASRATHALMVTLAVCRREPAHLLMRHEATLTAVTHRPVATTTGGRRATRRPRLLRVDGRVVPARGRQEGGRAPVVVVPPIHHLAVQLPWRACCTDDDARRSHRSTPPRARARDASRLTLTLTLAVGALARGAEAADGRPVRGVMCARHGHRAARRTTTVTHHRGFGCDARS